MAAKHLRRLFIATPSGVAMHVMELIGNRAFDERTKPAEVNTNGMPVGETQFTSASAFGEITGCDLDEPYKDNVQCDDIDDSHMAADEWQDVPFRLKDGKELPFDVQVRVFYVDSSNLDQPLVSGQRTLHKKVIVKVRSKRHVKQNRYNDGFVRLERIFSYDVKRAENRLKEKFPDAVSGPENNGNGPPDDDGGGDNNGGDEYDQDEVGDLDPNTPVWICQRRVRRGKISWSNRSVKQKFVQKHIGHGDTLGKCTN